MYKLFLDLLRHKLVSISHTSQGHLDAQYKASSRNGKVNIGVEDTLEWGFNGKLPILRKEGTDFKRVHIIW